tara:strand:+ start:1022 stop:1264 length:243 start_codon:yes stop_codon:yes gene_type:complete
MAIKIITSLIAISTCLLTVAQDRLNFDKLLSTNKLVFKKPDLFTEVATVENGDLHYDYALKYDLDSFEVRYSIFPPTFLD